MVDGWSNSRRLVGGTVEVRRRIDGGLVEDRSRIAGGSLKDQGKSDGGWVEKWNEDLWRQGSVEDWWRMGDDYAHQASREVISEI